MAEQVSMVSMPPMSDRRGNKINETPSFCAKTLSFYFISFYQAFASELKDGTDVATKPDRSIQTEEETLLLYEVTFCHGSEADLRTLLQSPVFSPLSQFRLGRKELLTRVLAILKSKGWIRDIFSICRYCLSEQDEVGNPLLLGSDWAVWKLFIAAARDAENVEPE